MQLWLGLRQTFMTVAASFMAAAGALTVSSQEAEAACSITDLGLNTAVIDPNWRQVTVNSTMRDNGEPVSVLFVYDVTTPVTSDFGETHVYDDAIVASCMTIGFPGSDVRVQSTGGAISIRNATFASDVDQVTFVLSDGISSPATSPDYTSLNIIFQGSFTALSAPDIVQIEDGHNVNDLAMRFGNVREDGSVRQINNLGAEVTVGSVVAVPEPKAFAFTLTAGLVVCLIRRRSGASSSLFTPRSIEPS